MTDKHKIDQNMQMLSELFQKDDDTILRENTMKDLKDMLVRIYDGLYPPSSYLSTKSKALQGLKEYYNSIRYTDALVERYGLSG